MVELKVNASAKDDVDVSYFIVRDNGAPIALNMRAGDKNYKKTLEVADGNPNLSIEFLLRGKKGGQLELSIKRTDTGKFVFKRKSPGFEIPGDNDWGQFTQSGALPFSLDDEL